MIDLHVHTTFSDGALIPAETARRARVAGYKALCFTDHVDHSNLAHILDCMIPFIKKCAPYAGIELFAGVEITHVPPALIPDLIDEARARGAQLVVVHGETLAEPVEEGTNLAALTGGADILAHPGLLRPEDAELAAEKGVHIELTTRKGHSLSNGHVCRLARAHGARLVINNDAHAPGDFISQEQRSRIALGAGLTPEECELVEHNSRRIVEGLLRR